MLLKDSFENTFKGSRKKNLIESDRRKESYNNIFHTFLIENSIKQYSTKKYLGDLFAERFNRTVRDLLKQPAFEKAESNWIGVLSTKMKQYNNRVHNSTKLTPIQASLERTKGSFTRF